MPCVHARFLDDLLLLEVSPGSTDLPLLHSSTSQVRVPSLHSCHDYTAGNREGSARARLVARPVVFFLIQRGELDDTPCRPTPLLTCKIMIIMMDQNFYFYFTSPTLKTR